MNKARVHTLCWDCAKACGGCSWSDYWERRPVPGWVAVETQLRLDNSGHGKSYIVMSCPEFERDGTDGGVYRWIDGERVDPWTRKVICGKIVKNRDKK